jgi:hypothetical protein
MTASHWTGRTASLAVLLLAAFGGCSKNDNNHHNILPLKASISFSNPPAGSPVVFMRVSSGDNPDDDLVPLEMVLRAGPVPVSFNAIDVEIHLENPSQPGVPAPGILQFVFDAGANQKTPFGPCGGSTTCTAQAKCDGTAPECSSAADCNSGICTFIDYTCDSAVSCDACLSCPSNPGFSASVMNPTCLSNLAGANTNGVVLLGIASTPNANCPMTRTVPTNNEIVLAHFGLLASAEGSVRVRFFTNPSSFGDCEILQGVPPVTDLGIPFDDGGAVFTAHR